MWIQNRIKITVVIAFIFAFILSLTSCMFKSPIRRFKEDKPDYDYLVIEFSETSYAWVDCNNVDGYGEWIFEQKTIPILFYFRESSAMITIDSLEGAFDAGEIYQYENPKDIILNAQIIGILYLRHEENDKQNKIATCYIEFVWDGLQNGMILSEEQEVFVKKATSEEWQQWMREHALEPNLYMP